MSSGARGWPRFGPGPGGPGPAGAEAKKITRGHGPAGAGAKNKTWVHGPAGAGPEVTFMITINIFLLLINLEFNCIAMV